MALARHHGGRARRAAASGGRRRAVAAASLLVAVAVLASGCGRTDLRERYVAERMAWRASKLAAAMRSNPDLATDEMQAEVERSYQAIVDRFPPTEGGPTTPEGRDVASIAGQSRLTLAGMASSRGDDERALKLLASVRDGYAHDRRLAIEAALAMGDALEAAGRWPEAVREFDALVAAWPPSEERGGAPDPRIVRTPLKVAAGYAVRGDAAAAATRFDAARAYYDRWIREADGAPTAALALELKGESFVQQGRYAEAVSAFTLLEERYGTEKNRAAIWLRLAEVYATGLGDERTAADYYAKVASGNPDDVSGATASIALAVLDSDAGRHADARARLEDVAGRFRTQQTVSATAMYYIALSYEAEGEWESAAARYSALAQEHPTTLYGMETPLRVARHYREAGENDAADGAYERAVEQYERVCETAPLTPADLAARSYLVQARLEQEEWAEAAAVLVETARRFAEIEAAPGMLFQAADLYASKLNDASKAADALAMVRDGYPGTDAAGEAEARLKRLR
jgi:tetratricopeptide (TPR) repeat protein